MDISPPAADKAPRMGVINFDAARQAGALPV
jgi:hypothetical protein